MLRRSITLLSETLVQKIAAGEVIDRPASIVKELLENSIDAGAKRIEVRATDGGRSAISVTDDGVGIPANEMAMALKAHATSKISSLEELEEVRTLGFRGEALASIAAVSHLDLLSRAVGAETGMRLSAEGGEIHRHEPFGMPAGTTVAISHLFYNTPARKKFLRSPSTEFGHIEAVLRRAALADIDREFLLERDGEVALHLPSSPTLRGRAEQMYGRETASQLIELNVEDGPLKLEGLISAGAISFGRAEEIRLFLNGRPIRDRMLQAALMEGYRTALMERRYPLAILKLTIPFGAVDVNVHPSKSEVRFSDSNRIFQLILRSVARTLEGASPILLSGMGQTRTPESDIAPPSFWPAVPSSGYDQNWPSVETARTSAAPYTEAPREAGPFSSLRHMGTLDETFLLLSDGRTLIVVDQHAAHERVLFERLRPQSQTAPTASQALLVPLTLELTAQRYDRLMAMSELLSPLGFELEPFGGTTLLIKSIPIIMGNHDPRTLLVDLADDAGLATHTGAIQEKINGVISRVACHSAVRAHDRLGPAEVQSLLEQMDETDLSAHCPHGRPTFLRFAIGDFERLFGRK